MQFNEKYEELGDLAMQVLNENQVVLNETEEDLYKFKRQLSELGMRASMIVKSCINNLNHVINVINDIKDKNYGHDISIHSAFNKNDDPFPEEGGNKALVLEKLLSDLRADIDASLKKYSSEVNDKVYDKLNDVIPPPNPMEREDRLFKKEPPPPKEQEPIPPNMKQQTIPGV